MGFLIGARGDLASLDIADDFNTSFGEERALLINALGEVIGGIQHPTFIRECAEEMAQHINSDGRAFIQALAVAIKGRSE